jgi:hypothetical protein
VRRQAIILGSTATVDHFVGRVRRVLQSLRLFGACHKKQCRVDWLSNRILKSSDDTAATPETASIGSGKLCPSRPPWVAERQGGEAHHPVLANCKAGSAPNDRVGPGGEVEKIQGVGARRPGSRVGFAIFVRNCQFSNDFKFLGRELDPPVPVMAPYIGTARPTSMGAAGRVDGGHVARRRFRTRV